MLRSIGAVLGGYLTMAVAVVVLVGAGAALLVDDPAAPGTAYLTFNLGVSLFAAVAGGWVAGRLAPRSPLAHVAALALLVLLLGVVVGSGSAEGAAGQPDWYPVAVAVIGFVGALAGGWLYARVDFPRP